ncbi:MAG: hypothetical protein COB04_10905 [Gammaproteobacteria bacterium]|nr:MAG: hypothetical protein COB04_10905 [Gammaproteobacteria bacterium]
MIKYPFSHTLSHKKINNSILGVDLAKDVIQVDIFKGKKLQSNKGMTPSNPMKWLINSQLSIVVFEACGTSNDWNQQATKYGHDSRLISARLTYLGSSTEYATTSARLPD